MRIGLLLLGFVIALLGSLLVLNQYVFKFHYGWDFLGVLSSQDYLAFERQVFTGNKIWFVIYAVSISAALFLVPTIFHRFGRRSIYGFLIGLIAASMLAALSGLVISQILGGQVIGGDPMLFYWVGFAFIILVVICMMVYAWHKSYLIMLRDWLIHLYAIIALPLTIFPMIYLWHWTLGFDIHEAMVTSVTIAFTGHFLISYFITVQVLGDK